MSRRGFYSVHPRYTPGSGAMVDERTARRLAADEKEAYEYARIGCMGPDEKTKAEKLGLLGIAEFLVEGSKTWTVTDLCTGEIYTRPFASKRVAS